MRNTSLTPAVQARICEALKAGNTRRAAALFGGIDERTFYEWLKRGTEPTYTRGGKLKAGEDVYVQFVQAVTQAEADCEVWHVANVKRHATDDWRASIEWLKRRRRDEWSERIDSDVTTKGEAISNAFIVHIHNPNDDAA